MYSFWKSSCSWRVRIGNLLKIYILIIIDVSPIFSFKFETNPTWNKADCPEWGAALGWVQKNQSNGASSRFTHWRHHTCAVTEYHAVPGGYAAPASAAATRCCEASSSKTQSQAYFPSRTFCYKQVREICEIIVSGIQPLQNECLIFEIPVGEEKQIEFAQRWISKGFKAVEQLLSQCAGKYCVGNEVTLADCCLIPQVGF